MSVEQAIINWSASRPPWQRAILRRVAKGDLLSNADYDELVENILASKSIGDDSFGLEQLPQVSAGDPPVTLVSIANPEHVNALASERPLTFEETGVTIIYGDNASGKSGFARLLKRIARARHREEVLSDVFLDTALANPKAALTVTIGADEKPIIWPESTPPELQRMLFYDEGCGDAYIETESDFPYRPSALFVMDGLIEACVAIRSRIDVKLEENTRSAKSLPVAEEDVKQTEIGKYLTQLSGSTSLEDLDTLIEKLDESTETIDDLKDQETRLQSADTTKERQKLTRQAAKLDSLQQHLEGLQTALTDDAVAVIQEERRKLKALEEAADLLAGAFGSEPLAGVGTSPWKELWESARRFSEAHAYLDDPFPVVGEDAKCVLCQQPLEEAARHRLTRFERFVQDDTQTRLRIARENWDARVESLTNLRTIPDTVETNLKDLEADQEGLVQATRELLAKYEAVRVSIVSSLPSTGDLPRSGLTPAETTFRLKAASTAVRTMAEGLSNPETIKQRLAAITTKRKELTRLRCFGMGSAPDLLKMRLTYQTTGKSVVSIFPQVREG